MLAFASMTRLHEDGPKTNGCRVCDPAHVTPDLIRGGGLSSLSFNPATTPAQPV
jgi:hypothetical protein